MRDIFKTIVCPHHGVVEEQNGFVVKCDLYIELNPTNALISRQL